MKVRMWCVTHDSPVENVGNGRIVYPTYSADPTPDNDGWFELDTSEYSCPWWSTEECEIVWEVQ